MNDKSYLLEVEIRLIKLRQFPTKNLNSELIWLAQSLGLLNKRDKDKSCYRLFIELIKASKTKEMLTSDELAARLNLTRATVIHHMKTLDSLGLIKKINNGYILHSDSLFELFREIDNNYKKTMRQILSVAKNIDEQLNLLR